MKKRLRKKKHTGEYKEFGVSFAIKRNTKDKFDTFLDDFLEQAVEANNCYCGGGGKEEKFEGFIELGRLSSQPENALKRIIHWLGYRSDVEKYIFGEIVDAWYGPHDDIDL
ncbi:conserved hypothetical protein [Desulfamplus magnetovallimortis]|uniref:DUF469 family protein n=1 Tax=Desulfamplus magnetovallimortis TaxID=1246637 RepID=A0A1W1HID2_9BACT|nr:50S ribosome-binding protein YggL [Desulfamplus magnetovallimortis]SLM32175.1 conserved hypothetical protein [Desulfamplus magnetovallimortis]